MSAVRDLVFLRKIQRLLSESEYVTTYAFAMLQALADLSVESPYKSGGHKIPLTDIAGKFIEYYWRQAIPYAPELGRDGMLKQNTGEQASVINSIIEARKHYWGSLHLARQDETAWGELLDKVLVIIREQPLWRLQRVGPDLDEFIYRQGRLDNGCIRLLPGVPAILRAYHGMISNLVQGCWLGQVRRVRGNRELLGDRGDLVEFLFGSERTSPDSYREVLRNYQQARCFYCSEEVKGAGHADHFIPWSRYPFDLGHNFVFAHRECNWEKSDRLAHPDHLAHWFERNIREPAELDEAFNFNSLEHDVQRCRNVAYWAYQQGEVSKVHTYRGRHDYPLLDDRWRAALGA